MNRTALGLALSAFVVVGFVFWVAGMPKPADATLSAGLTADVLAARQQPDPGASSAAVPPAGAVVSDEWVLSVAAQTGIPSRALEAYANAAIAQQAATPSCGLGWNVLAAIGQVESEHSHGRTDPSSIDDAARTAAAYLCDADGTLTTVDGWNAAITRYNPDPAYLFAIGAQAERYAAAAP